MEHVAEQLGEGIAFQVKVQCHANILNAKLQPPTNLQDFYSFPEKCGWQIREPDFKILPGQQPRTTLSEFLQSWLYFGLIITVVQTEREPILCTQDLVSEVYLSTKYLNRKLHEWANWEKAHSDGLRLRMIQVGLILDYARQVIQKNCAYIENTVGYDTNDDSELHMDDKQALVLMCLGETLSEAKASIMSSKESTQSKVKVHGWDADDDAGWGPPRYVLEGMERNGWCKREIRLLKGQLRSNATMLMSAYDIHSSSKRTNEDHSSCTPYECMFKHENTFGFSSIHIGDCQGCEHLGPGRDKIQDILQEDGDIIPLLRFRTVAGAPTLDVERYDLSSYRSTGSKPEFVTISHVWSDGWGNEWVNKLSTCRLNYIRKQIGGATRDQTTLFWMDTLVVPVGTSHPHLKKKAIRQLFRIFDESQKTIVLDKGLNTMNRGNPSNPAEAAMRILSSVWMRQLWTLQEAYFSRQILIPFEEGDGGTLNQLELDVLEKELDNSIKTLPTSGIIRPVRDRLSYIMMGQERRNRRNRLDDYERKQTSEENAALVASTWRAIGWRSTGNPNDEILALVTLLNLKYEGTKIEKARLSNPYEHAVRLGPKGRGDLAAQFWTLLENDMKGSIPSGMIFLPGPRLNREGFGWAPETCLSAHELAYPDPLRLWRQATVLSRDGLQVQYPGFLLYPDSSQTRGRILGTNVGTDPEGNAVKFSFPVDRGLREWYSFRKPTDEKSSGQLTRLQSASTTLAIILSGAQPRELLEEIALLVEIENYGSRDSKQRPVYHTRIIHRIMVWKEPSHLHTQESRFLQRKGHLQGPAEPSVCFGDVLDSSQLWWVDGYLAQDNIIREEDLGYGNEEEYQSDNVVDDQKTNRMWKILEAPAKPASTYSVEQRFLDGMDFVKVLNRRTTTTVKVEFTIDWDFCSFHNEQAFSENVETVLETAITLIGNENNVQAATCIDYVRQTWGNEGVEVLRYLQDIIKDSSNSQGFKEFDSSPASAKLSNSTKIEAHWRGPNLIFLGSGISSSVAKLGEQLAWMSTALASCKDNTGITYCRPVIGKKESLYDESLKILEEKWFIKNEKIRSIVYDNNETIGACWIGLFRNPNVVVGYPIPKRSRSDSGLEVSFDIMAALANTTRLVDFQGRTFAKGFSTMLGITKVVNNTIWWHLCFNKDMRYISFEDPRMPRALGTRCTVDSSVLSTYQHILGWSMEVKSLAGSPDADYDRIRPSGLGLPPSSFAFDKASVSGGRYVSVGLSCSIGIKDKPEYINYGEDYVSTLMAISERHFLFYDVGERQAWLIDGLSTVLHLLRTFLKDCRADKRLRNVLLPGFDELTEAPDDLSGGDAAFDILHRNQNIQLWHKDRSITEEMTLKLRLPKEEALKSQVSFFCVKDKVMQICSILQQITAHIDNIQTRDGVGFRLKFTARHHLEGFDFVSLATNQGTIWPKVDTISEFGEGWVDFTRAIYSPALFGRGFGQMFQPLGQACATCGCNAPPGKDLLAVSVTDLKQIMHRHGDSNNNPCLLAPNIFWHTPDRCFESCKCSTASPQKRDCVQLCLPGGLRNRGSRAFRSPPEIFEDSGPCDSGAVLFGYSWKFPLRWGKSQFPQENKPITGIVKPDTIHDDLMRMAINASICGTEISNDVMVQSSPILTGASASNLLLRKLYQQDNRQFLSTSKSSAVLGQELPNQKNIDGPIVASNLSPDQFQPGSEWADMADGQESVLQDVVNTGSPSPNLSERGERSRLNTTTLMRARSAISKTSWLKWRS